MSPLGNIYLLKIKKRDGTYTNIKMQSIDDKRALFEAERAFMRPDGLQIRRDLDNDYPVIEDIDENNITIKMEELDEE